MVVKFYLEFDATHTGQTKKHVLSIYNLQQEGNVHTYMQNAVGAKKATLPITPNLKHCRGRHLL